MVTAEQTQNVSCPFVFQVCGSVRSEPCTPQQCDGDDLCPPEGTSTCEKGEECVGALPLGKRAEADAKDVKDRLNELSDKITQAAEKVSGLSGLGFFFLLYY